MRARFFVFLLAASFCFWPPYLAAAKPPGDDRAIYFQQIVEQTFQLSHPGAHYVAARHKDLEQEFSAIAGSAPGVLFYEIRWGTPAAGNNESIWTVAPEASGQESYQLYHFESSEGLTQVTLEFNRLMTELARPIPAAQMPNLARFFLSCCVRGDEGEVVTDEESVRHAVERYYLNVFGDTPRMLSAYAQWWTAYQASGVSPASGVGPASVISPTPTTTGKDIAVKRIVLAFGTHPQLQQWDMLVSDDARVRVRSFEPVFFPEGDQWVFYDFQSGIRMGSTRAVPPALPQYPAVR